MEIHSIFSYFTVRPNSAGGNYLDNFDFLPIYQAQSWQGKNIYFLQIFIKQNQLWLLKWLLLSPFFLLFLVLLLFLFFCCSGCSRKMNVRDFWQTKLTVVSCFFYFDFFMVMFSLNEMNRLLLHCMHMDRKEMTTRIYMDRNHFREST